MAMNRSRYKMGFRARSWLLILPMFVIGGLVACSAAELEPLFKGTIPVTREGRPTETLPALQPAPSGTPTPVQLVNDLATIAVSGLTTSSPPAISQTIPAESNSDLDSPSPAGLISPTPTPWDVPYQGPTPTPVPPPPGLIYEDEFGMWLVADNWQPDLLADIERGAILSPDGDAALYYSGDDIWMVDVASGERRNLTEETGRTHCCAQWWPARPETLVFGSWPAESDLGPTTGYLTTLDLVDGSYQVLDEESLSNGVAAPGPDGQRIAYDRGGNAWLFHWDEGLEPLAPTDFGLDNVTRIGGPAWSPDGQKLAWTVAVSAHDGNPRRIALAIFDLEAGNGSLLHLYENIGRGGWFEPPAWSPDGRWLAFVAEDINLELNGIWAVAVDGSREHYLGPGSNPTWSPDTHWLVYTAYSLELDPAEEIHLAEVESWYTIKMQLPPGSTIRGWQE